MAHTKQGVGGERNPRNIWNHSQRLTLHILRERFDFSSAQRTQIFNNLFADHLRRQGFPHGMKGGAINAQYTERDGTKPCSIKIWKDIKQPPASAEELARWEMIEEQIKRAAATILGCNRTPQSAPPSRSAKTSTWNASQRPRSDVGLISGRGKIAIPEQILEVSTAENDHTAASPAMGSKRKRASDDSVCPSPTPLTETIELMGFDSDDNADQPSPTPRPRRNASRYRISQWAFQPPQYTDNAVDSDSDVDFVPEETATRIKRNRASPEVVIPSTPRQQKVLRKEFAASAGLPTPPKTPKNRPTSIAIRKAKATHEYSRPQGQLMLTYDELQMTKQPLIAPTEAEAHPPLAGLLFRYWTDECFSKLNEDGEFVAGRFANFSIFGTEAPPLPTLQNFKYFWHDVGAHMNREPVQSPWISTCNHLNWIIRLAVQESKKGVASGRITILNAHAIDRNLVFHAQPFHKELSKKRPFTNGAFRYQGMREFLIYHKIPKEAVLYTFTVQKLVQLTAINTGVGDLLRLQHLSKSMVAMTTLTQTLKAHGLGLDQGTVTAIAAIVRFFNFTCDAVPEHIMHLVSDLVQGWSIVVSYQSPEQWSSMSNVFASAMVTAVTPSWIKDLQKMKSAFLDGVRWSQGDVNARHKAEKMQTMLTRARRIGLDDPAKILRNELDAAKLGVIMYDQRQKRLLQGGASQAVLMDEDDEDDSMPITPRSVAFRPGDRRSLRYRG